MIWEASVRLASLCVLDDVIKVVKVGVPRNNLCRTGSYSEKAEEREDHSDTETPDWNL